MISGLYSALLCRQTIAGHREREAVKQSEKPPGRVPQCFALQSEEEGRPQHGKSISDWIMSRRQRRAGHQSEGQETIALRQPLLSTPVGKTLIQQAAEREAELAASTKTPQYAAKPSSSGGTHPSSFSSSTSSAIQASSPTHSAAILTTLLYAPTLTLLHYTFHILVLHQYSQLGSSLTSSSEPSRLLLRLLWQTFRRYFLVYAVLIYIAHTPVLPFSWYPRARQGVFFTIASAAGCALVNMTNRAPYLQMVEKAPVVGSLWVWCTLELGVEWAVGMMVVVLGYTWQGGFGIS